MRITFFVGSVIGYVENPSALLTRGLAHGLSLRGHDVRVVEPRRNAAFERTLREAGGGASRHFFQSFSTFQHHSYEPRTGAQMLEWVTREIALIDVAVVVAGAGDELVRWMANVTREGLVRSYLAWSPDDLQPHDLEELEIALYDLVLAPFETAGIAPRSAILAPTFAGMDVQAGLTGDLEGRINGIVDPVEAAIIFERASLASPAIR